ncbi:GNAT family N-acetyltransferase [Aestuariibacter halophilus]|uniref:GNAT family N-acetyltransferase n=1 Tax=Fluctibacter halophilus TaxID=226011 RepID=A0ABS8G6E4_9ALTE|nr:GNAT family N-acetyltransferase [Aestuariibacter halophilus]MCC2616093.1 GNAT family N-acetyltransferase [Aestuariibacter halophilus]
MNHKLQRNINNLQTLWHAYGASSLGNLLLSHQWPNKIWMSEQARTDTPATLSQLLTLLKLHPQHVLSVWCPEDNKNLTNALPLQPQTQLTAMALSLDEQAQSETETIAVNSTTTSLQRMSSPRQQSDWCTLCSAGFGYQVSVRAITNACRHHNAELLALTDHSIPVATALVLRTGKTLGIHQVAVPPEHRGKGYAKTLMQHIVWQAAQQSVNLLVLQASDMGRSLYQSMGFESLATINHYSL